VSGSTAHMARVRVWWRSTRPDGATDRWCPIGVSTGVGQARCDIHIRRDQAIPFDGGIRVGAFRHNCSGVDWWPHFNITCYTGRR
jgi:hypothetical protein